MNKDVAAVPEHLDKALQYLDQVLALNPDSANMYVQKRIVMNKYALHEQQQMSLAQAEANGTKNKKKKDEALARAAEHQKKVAEYQAQFQELSTKYTEAAKRLKEKKAAAEAAAAQQQQAAPAPK
jgi:hypothetical protein